MGSYINIIIDVIIGAIILLFILLSTILYRIGNQRSRKAKLEKMIDKTKKDRIAKADSTLGRIQIIATNNNKFKSLYRKLGETFDLMNLKTEINLKDIGHLLLNNKNLKNKEFTKSIQKIERNIAEINELEIKFNSNAMKVTQQDEFTRSEQSFYNKHLRLATNIYREKKVLLEEISPKIDLLLDEIAIMGRDFNEAIVRADTFETNRLLKIYARNVIVFCEIINKGPMLQVYIFDTLPKLAMALEKLYKDMKIKFKLKFNNVNFADVIGDISNRYLDIKDNFLNLRIENLDIRIKDVMKKIKIVENDIDREVTAYSAFKINFNKTLEEIHGSLEEFLNVKDQFNHIRKTGAIINHELMEKYKKMFKNSKLIDEIALEYREINKGSTLSNCVKLASTKKVIIKLENFNQLIEDVKKRIYEIQVQKLKLKNKFTRTNEALETLLRATKMESIVLPEEAKVTIDEIKKSNGKIIKIISNKNMLPKDEDTLNSHISKMIKVYKIIAGTKKLSEIVRNLNGKYSANRATNKNLNYQLTLAEREYLEGKYASAVNSIIIFLEGE